MATRRQLIGMMVGAGTLTLTGLAPGGVRGQDATPRAEASPYAPRIDPANFVEAIDNPYFPLVPGTTFTYEGITEDGPETNEVAVTTDTKVVMGVTCVVVRDVVRVNGEVVEDTLDWYAQDREGNVWYFGEASTDLEDGEVVSTEGSWEAGVGGALPGIAMLANPSVGDRYRQEYDPGEAEDTGEVLRFEDGVETPYGTFDEVLVTRDANSLEPGHVEEKFYAPGVGLIRATAVAGPAERIELTSISPGAGATPTA